MLKVRGIGLGSKDWVQKIDFVESSILWDSGEC